MENILVWVGIELDFFMVAGIGTMLWMFAGKSFGNTEIFQLMLSST